MLVAELNLFLVELELELSVAKLKLSVLELGQKRQLANLFFVFSRTPLAPGGNTTGDKRPI
jgi:hypothetical protein